MKQLFRQVVNKFLFFFGFYITRQKGVNDFIYSLNGFSKDVNQYRISQYVKILRDMNCSKSYDFLIKNLIQNRQFEILNTEFVGKGFGQGSLNVFRKVYTKDGIYFEKIYLNSGIQLDKILWFNSEIQNLIENEITTPHIKYIIKGKFITAVYFDYLKLRKLGQEEAVNVAVQLSITLFERSLAQFKFKPINNIGNKICCDYNNHFQYSKNIKRAEEILKKNAIDYMFFKAKLQHSVRVITHGDIQITNIYGNNTLLDWDSVGYYPIGLEVAFIYYRLIFKEVKVDSQNVWLEKNYKNLIPSNLWKSFQLNFNYFLFIFSVDLFNNDRYIHLERTMLSYLSDSIMHEK